jgi:Ca2+-binding RTX toxin-like protein
MAFGATFNLSTLNGVNGFVFSGGGAGVSVAAGGDLNGDGIDDVLVRGASDAWVLYGRDTATQGGFAGTMTTASVDGVNGIRVLNLSGSVAPQSIARAGDINGDGFEDFVVGSQGALSEAAPSTFAGSAYVIFGGAGGLAAVVSARGLNGADGFALVGAANDSRTGYRVGAAGDLNHDGIDDLVVTAAPTNGQNGKVYVIFGKDTATQGAFQHEVLLAGLNGANGFVIQSASGIFGSAGVAAAGDLNNDGIDDLAIGQHLDGRMHVLFGRETQLSGDFQAAYADTDLTGAIGQSAFDPSDGRFGYSVAVVGDIDGDGLDDLAVGAFGNSGLGVASATYVIFGRAAGLPANFSVAGLDGTNGFRIQGTIANWSGFSVAAAGDVNGDGREDLIVVAPLGKEAYVVYGRDAATDPFGATLSLASLSADDGFRIAGTANLTGFSVSGAGDVNGDGIDDLVVGSSGAGQAYVIFGQTHRTLGPAGGTLDGGASHDTLEGGAGNDLLNGLAGDDQLNGWDMGDVLNGGDGADQLQGWTGGDVLNGDAGDDQLLGQDGGDKLFGGLGIDYLSGGTGNDRMDGGDGADALEGNEGNDYLDGGAGDDGLYGGAGNDIYLFQAGEDDTAIEFAGEGFDVVRSWRSVSDLWFHIEGLELQGGADLDGTGNANANNLQGNAGANTLSGLAGVDTINGNDGDDLVRGGAGNDLLRGGLGADRFAVGQDSLASATLETDQVYDFSAAEGDIIDLSGMDAIAGGGDDAFTLVGAFTRHAGEMTLSFAGGITTLKLDVTGDGKVDYQMKINGDITGESGDWLL